MYLSKNILCSKVTVYTLIKSNYNTFKNVTFSYQIVYEMMLYNEEQTVARSGALLQDILSCGTGACVPWVQAWETGQLIED